MPIQARPQHKGKTQGSIAAEKDKIMTFNEDQQLKQTAQFGSSNLQLGGTESPRQRPGSEIEAAIQEANYGAYEAASKTDKKPNDRGLQKPAATSDFLIGQSSKRKTKVINPTSSSESLSLRNKSSVLTPAIKDDHADVQRWRSDRFDSSLHQRLAIQKDLNKKHRLKFTEKLQTNRPSEEAMHQKEYGQHSYQYINQQPIAASQPSLIRQISNLEKVLNTSGGQRAINESTGSEHSFYQ